MDQARLTYLFQRYVDNTCTESERLELMALIDKADHDNALRQQLDHLWETLPDSKMDARKSDKILATILAGHNQTEMVLSAPGRTRWLRVAAAAAVLLLAGAGAYLLIPSPAQRDLATAQQAPATEEHRFIKLPDGSKVILNAGSTLEYPDFNGGSKREVSLQGEAFFDIVHDPEHPFIVRTGNLTTTVLGTAFNIKAYASERDITVTVARGKVKVSDEAHTLGVITPNQQISFNKTAGVSTQRVVDSRAVLAWTANDIYFDDITLADAARQLEVRFGVRVRVSEVASGCKFTATFMNGEDLEQILQVICAFNDAHYARQPDGTVTIDGKGCS